MTVKETASTVPHKHQRRCYKHEASMSQQGVSEPGPPREELWPKYGTINHGTRDFQREGHQLSKEEIEETRRRDEEMNQRVKQMDQTLLLIPVTMVAYRLGIHAWNSWYVAILVILATGVQAQEANLSQNRDGQLLRGINVSQEAY